MIPARLSGLIFNKRVRLTDTTKDNYGRILANVWEGGLLVNKVLIEEGLVKFEYVTSPYYEELKTAGQRAKELQLGVFSGRCKSQVPKNNCLIKGNFHDGKKYYFLPDCPQYKQTVVDESYGDLWFCTQEEAIKAGFEKTQECD